MSLPCLNYFPISFPIKFKLLPMVYNVWVPSFLNFMITSLSSLFLQMHFPLKTPLILPAWKALSSFLPPDSCTFFKKASLTAWTWPVFPQSPLLTHPLSLMSHIQPDQNCWCICLSLSLETVNTLRTASVYLMKRENLTGTYSWATTFPTDHEHFYRPPISDRTSLVAQTVKNLPAMQETWIWSLGWEDPLKKGMGIQDSCLENSVDREAWWATLHGVTRITRIEHGWATNTFAFNIRQGEPKERSKTPGHFAVMFEYRQK